MRPSLTLRGVHRQVEYALQHSVRYGYTSESARLLVVLCRIAPQKYQTTLCQPCTALNTVNTVRSGELVPDLYCCVLVKVGVTRGYARS